MSRRCFALPKYQGPHKSGERAYCRYKGKTIYFGKFGSEESEAEFKRFIKAILDGQDKPQDAVRRPDGHPVAYLVERYLTWAKGYYEREYTSIREACRHLIKLHADTPIVHFGPLALKAVRQAMIDGDWARSHINHQVHRLRRMFRWGVGEEIVPPNIIVALGAVQSLTLGHTDAREAEPVPPVEDAVVETTLPYLSPLVATMVRVQRAAGMRPGEVCAMVASEIDRSGPIWFYSPVKHKNAWRKKQRLIAIMPWVQAELQPYLDRAGDGYVFSPAAMWQERVAASRVKSRSSNKQRKIKLNRRYRERYRTESYAQAVGYGIAKANAAINEENKKTGGNVALIPAWTPGQMRHTAADEADSVAGPGAAQKLLGHSHASTTAIYLEQSKVELTEVANKLTAARAAKAAQEQTNGDCASR